MSSLSDVCKIGISYTGFTTFQKAWDISLIDIQFKDVDLDISAKLVAPETQGGTQYPEFQTRERTGNSWKDKLSELKRDLFAVPPAIAKTIKLSARIFKDGGAAVIRDNLPVFLESLPTFQGGKCYFIQVALKEDALIGKIEEVAEKELERRIRLARLYPNRMIYESPKEIALTSEEQLVYDDFEAIVYGIGGWIERFAESIKVAPPKNDSLYQGKAKEVLKELVKKMGDEAIRELVQVKQICEVECINDSLKALQKHRKAQIKAMKSGGYATIMRRILEMFAGDKAMNHKEIIEKMSAEYADRFLFK